jgi:hypothetical protein
MFFELKISLDIALSSLYWTSALNLEMNFEAEYLGGARSQYDQFMIRFLVDINDKLN